MSLLFSSIRVALRALFANKLRSSLTMLGIIIGVGAVIALVGAGQGAQAQVTARFEGLGSNLLTITPGAAIFRGISQGGGSATPLTNGDVEAIASLSTSVAAIAPEYTVNNGQIVFGSRNTQSTVAGVTPSYMAVNNWQLARGRFISDLDLASRNKVVVLGSAVLEELFDTNIIDPLGKTVKINRQNYEVIGILTSKGASGGMAGQDNRVMIPLTTAQLKFGGAGNTTLSAINAQVASKEQMAYAQAELTAILRASRGLSGTQADNFFVQNQTQIVESLEETTQTFTVLLGSIAAISLLVGGIGVMNIMLVSVTERTREIGIRKAVGAKQHHILTQFLIEAMTLGLVGGVLGVLAGYGGAQAVTPMLGAARAVIRPDTVMMALAVSLGVGLFFGLYPASRAAALNPIDALRYE